MRVFAMLLLLGAASNLCAQQDYLVTVKNDTIRGPIRIMSYDIMDRAAVTADGKKQNFTAVQIRSMFIDSVRYAPVQNDKKIRFMQVLRPGYLTLYGYRIENQASYDGRLLSKMNGETLDVPNIGFKRILADFLNDCPTTASKVKEGEFSRTKLEEIIDDYNSCVAEQNKVATTMVKPTPALEALMALRSKVQASEMESKKDVTDMLNDMEGRLQRGQTVPPYLTNGVKSSLSGKQEFEEELNKLLSLLN